MFPDLSNKIALELVVPWSNANIYLKLAIDIQKIEDYKDSAQTKRG